MEKKLVFRIGEESVPMVMNVEEVARSPFAEALSKAKDMVLTLIDGYEEDKGDSGDEKDFLSHRVKNNIVAFLGDRGSGKTSCLLSFKEVLRHDSEKSVRELAEKTFFLSIVDPSFFDKEHNILEIVIGFIYKEYDALLQQWESRDNEWRNRMRKFQRDLTQVKEALIFLEKPSLKEEDDRIESLATLSEGVLLVEAMHRLIQSFLDCLGMRYLVISIDDLDLNVTEAFKMMEQIRKYLVLPNVVILLAAKFKQLHHSIELYMTQHYESILSESISPYTIREMADRYLDKFIPLTRRIEMPGCEDFDAIGLEIIPEGDVEADKDNRYDSVHFAVLSLIYKKCGYLFYNHEDLPSLIIPNNLRELKAFVTKFYSLPDRTSKDIHERNKWEFKDYFNDIWMQRLEGIQKTCALTIQNERDITKINKTVVSLLYQVMRDVGMIGDRWTRIPVGTETSSINKGFREILNPDNYSENISIGDVMVMVSELRRVSRSSQIEPFLFFITTFYSMKLYELYDEMTESVDKEEAIKLENDSLPEKSSASSHLEIRSFPKLKSNIDHKVPGYLKLVGNSFFNLKGDTFIPIGTQPARNREQSIMNGSLLTSEFNKIKKEISECNSKTSKTRKQELFLRFNMIEFFVLCSSRIIKREVESVKSLSEDKWRTEVEDVFFTPFEKNTRYILFDVTAPFVNTIFPKYAYDRFDKELYEIAVNNEESLLYKIRSSKRRYEKDEKVSLSHDLMSRMAIRNMEVLEDLGRWLINRKNNDIEKSASLDEIEALQLFFSRFNYSQDGLEFYSVRTYEKNQGTDDYHTIDFSPLNVLYDFLTQLLGSTKRKSPNKKATDSTENVKSNQNQLRDTFKRIYRAENHVVKGEHYSIEELKFIISSSGEEDILKKEKIVSAIMSNSSSMKSDDIMKNLAGRSIYEKMIFTKIWDKELADSYQKLIRDDLDNQIKDLHSEIKERTEFVNDLKSILNNRKSDIEDIGLKLFENERTIEGEKSKLDSYQDLALQAEASIREIHRELNSISHRRVAIRKMAGEISNKISEIENKLNELSQWQDKVEIGQNLYIYIPNKAILPTKEDTTKKEEKLRKELNDFKEKREELIIEREGLNTERRNYEEKLEHLKINHTNHISSIAACQALLQKKREYGETLLNSLNKTQAEIDNLKNQIIASEMRIKALNNNKLKEERKKREILEKLKEKRS